MTCIQASSEVQYLKPEHEKKSPSGQAAAADAAPVQKGSLTTCLTTDSAGALGNSGIKSGKE